MRACTFSVARRGGLKAARLAPRIRPARGLLRNSVLAQRPPRFAQRDAEEQLVLCALCANLFLPLGFTAEAGRAQRFSGRGSLCLPVSAVPPCVSFGCGSAALGPPVVSVPFLKLQLSDLGWLVSDRSQLHPKVPHPDCRMAFRCCVHDNSRSDSMSCSRKFRPRQLQRHSAHDGSASALFWPVLALFVPPRNG